jgi:hypothetical protein
MVRTPNPGGRAATPNPIQQQAIDIQQQTNHHPKKTDDSKKQTNQHPTTRIKPNKTE